MTNFFEQDSSENGLAKQEDFERFHDEIQQAVKSKSEQLGVTEEEIMEKLGVGEYSANIDADGNAEKRRAGYSGRWRSEGFGLGEPGKYR